MARKAELLSYHQVIQKRVDSSRSCTPPSPFWFWLQAVGDYPLQTQKIAGVNFGRLVPGIVSGLPSSPSM